MGSVSDVGSAGDEGHLRSEFARPGHCPRPSARSTCAAAARNLSGSRMWFFLLLVRIAFEQAFDPSQKARQLEERRVCAQRLLVWTGRIA